MTQLPNPFLNPSVISPRTEGSAVASKPPPVADATAAPFSVSPGVDGAFSHYGRGESVAMILAPVPGENRYPLSEPIAVARTDVLQTVGTTVSVHGDAEPSMTMEVPSEASAPAPTKNPDADALDLTDCISEIFFYARKLMKQPPRFVLDEAAFMADIDETPLFIREDGYLRRQA